MNNSKFWLAIFFGILSLGFVDKLSAQFNTNFSIATSTGKYAYNYNQVPDNLIITVSPAGDIATGLMYQWEQSATPAEEDFNAIPGATQSTYVFANKLSETSYFRLKVSNSYGNNIIYSGIIKLQLVSVNWEDINYVREHDVLKSGFTDWKTVDGLTIGDKLQTTSYLDGLGRSVQKISRETSVPSSGTLWGDIVQFSEYDSYGRQVKQYLPYSVTNTSESGKYKSTPANDQSNYYSSVFNETSPFNQVSYEDNPLSRVKNIKSSGTSWAAGTGNSMDYDVNTLEENVQNFTIGFNTGDYPVSLGGYPANTLYKNTHTDENGKKVIEYTNMSGQLILAKTQIDNAPSVAHNGWICVYSVYDDFGLLRYRIQPEGVKWLDNNGWSFTGTDGQTVLKEQCFRYEYDEKGRTILKKAPGADPLRMLYDKRDRVVFMQDGNQAVKSTPEWTANLYDELDRTIITTLYHTTKTTTALQTDINNATSSTITVTDPASPVINLVVDNRDVTVTRYAAQNTIEFVSDAGGNFISENGAVFTAEIDPAASTSSTSSTTSVYNNPISSSDLNNSAVTTIVKYQYYDDYSFTGARNFDNAFDNTTAYATGGEVLAITPTKRTTSYSTGSKTRVLGTNTFLTATAYYDEKGRPIQTIEDNIKQGLDVITMQYQWDGRLLSAHSKHSLYNNFGILTKNIYDKIGRVTSIQKKFGTNAFKTISSYDYDDMGRLKTKHLDPGYTSSGKTEMESLTYSCNLHGSITGINKDYALKTAGKYDKWGNFFGMYLGYDDVANFTLNPNKMLDGHIKGIMWNTQGDDAQRMYEYSYDNAGRLASATFKELQAPGGTWDNSKMDFSVNGTGPNNTIVYDLNGNLQNMIQRGVLIGTATPVNIDNLTYTYAQFSNKLVRVTDGPTQASANGKSEDFKDGSNTGDDYVYDNNGNVVIDLNKNIKELSGTGTNGIVYNYLDKPEQIKIVGKGLVKIVYDANGSKLQKIYTPDGSSTTTTTTYINGYVYKETVTGSSSSGLNLQYINFEEGRIRPVTPVSQDNGLDGLAVAGNMTLPDGKQGAYDFFIRDYLGNVRMILTEEVHTGKNTATMESNRATVEEPYFGQAGAANEVSSTRFAKPAGWNANTSSMVSKLSKATGHTVGPNSLLKVMAGDAINAQADYYFDGVINNNNNSLVADVVTTLVQSISTSSLTPDLVHGNTANIATDLNNSAPFANVADHDQTTPGSLPRAYLNVLFFDERFNFVPENSTSLRVSQTGDGAQPLILSNLKAPKNGYAYVYVSNENDEAVYFDNLKVMDTRGRIIEENHYYAYGLRITAISSKKVANPNEGAIDNKNLYNDKELIDDADLDWYDYGFRNYDAQIGRFMQLDPLTFSYPIYTPYQYAGNEPIYNIDLDGLEPWAGPEAVVHASIGTAKLGKTASWVSLQAMRYATYRKNNQPLTPVSRTVYNYTNSNGQTFSTRENHGESIDYLGEQWNYSGTSLETYYERNPLDGLTDAEVQARYSYFYRAYNRLWKQGIKYAWSEAWGMAGRDWNRGHGRSTGGNGWHVTNDFYTNGDGGTTYSDQALGNDELGSSFMFDLITLPAGATESAVEKIIVGNGGKYVSSMNIVREINHGEKVADLIELAQYRTYTTGVEHAIVKLGPNSIAPGARVLVSGGPHGISFELGEVETIFGHTHPYVTGISGADREALRILNQSKQYIFEGFNSTPLIARP